MKIIDLLNKIANGEEVPKRIRIYHWCYKFEWKDYAGNYIDEHEDIDLMSCLSCDKEELNYEVHEIEEKELPEKLPYYSLEKIQKAKNKDEWLEERISLLEKRVEDLHIKMNELIDYLEKQSKGE